MTHYSALADDVVQETLLRARLRPRPVDQTDVAA
ncbi:DNA-directed RNA polymerase specialized sigma24 family protein [Cryobacterium sp. CAN_C3]|nr:DNA-directed RNA polymerase specialized sigma24 family protein [Cryobacterium sp. CAN_C3]